MQLPEPEVVSKFYQFAGSPQYNRLAKTYQASCPICREGKSWLKKKRLFYVPRCNRVSCFNCGWSGTAYRWVKEVSGLTYNEIMRDSEEYETIDVNVRTPKALSEQPTLPGDCINLFDKQQLKFYKNNKDVSAAWEYVKKRRLNTAVNRPNTLYYCRDSSFNNTHDKRLVIPFVDCHGKIVFYQSRSINPADTRAKYLSKGGSERTLFNLNKISPDSDYVFVFEGPINAFFVDNSTAVAGIQENSLQLFTERQQEQIYTLSKTKEIVWVMDSQWLDVAGFKKTIKLIEMKQKVFIWPKDVGTRFKDFNDICMALKMDVVKEKFILDHTHEGLEAQMLMQMMRAA